MACSGSPKAATMHGSQLPEFKLTTSTDVQPSLAAVGLVDLLLLFCGRRRVLQVEGYSMWPTLKPKDRVILRPLNQHAPLPKIGGLIVCTHPHQPSLRVVKRLNAIVEDQLTVLGDCPQSSTDSRQWGNIPRSCLIGEVVAIVKTRHQNKTSDVF